MHIADCICQSAIYPLFYILLSKNHIGSAWVLWRGLECFECNLSRFCEIHDDLYRTCGLMFPISFPGDRSGGIHCISESSQPQSVGKRQILHWRAILLPNSSTCIPNGLYLLSQITRLDDFMPTFSSSRVCWGRFYFCRIFPRGCMGRLEGYL